MRMSIMVGHGEDSRPALYGDLRRLRKVFVWYAAAVMAGFAAGLAIVLLHGDAGFALIISVGLLPAAAAFLLILRDRLEASAILLALTLFAVLTALATTGLGIHHVSNVAFPVVMVISSMVTKKRTLVLLAAAAVGCVAWLVFGELAGAYTPKVLTRSVAGDFFSVSLVILSTALVARVVSETLLDNNLRLEEELAERTRAQTGRRESEKRFQALVETTCDFIWEIDPEGRYTYCSPQVRALWGFDSQQMLGKSPFDLIGGPEKEQVLEAFTRLMASGAAFRDMEVRSLDAAGMVKVLDVSGVPFFDSAGTLLGYRGITRDITERRQAEEVLRQRDLESESRFRAFVEQAPVAVGLFNMQGFGIYANAKFAETLGLKSPAEAIGRPASDYFAPQFREQSRERTRRRLQGLPVPAEYESVSVRSDGTEFPVHLAVSPVQLGAETASIAFLTDITERKRAEAEKVRLESQLRQAQKMESVGRLAGGVAHDFNNMLSVILGNAELALEESGTTPAVRGYLQEISGAAGRSAELTRQLLAFARKQAIVPRVLDLEATVEGMLKMLRRLIGEGVSLAWLPGVGTWPVRLDPSQVDQVLANLCVNARDAIAGVGTVTIRTANAVLDDAWCASHPHCLPGEYVMISVSDDGCGMEQEVIDRLFEPFFTTKEEGRGTGLGLATVYGIVRQNNGVIDVSSEPCRGSTFRIYLPRHEGDPAKLEPAKLRGAAARNSETVLLVEDEPAVLGMVKTMLEKAGYRVLSTSQPREALRLAAEHAGEIHLLITDVIMPEMNGKELARALSARSPRLKCLYTSGYAADVITDHQVLDEGVDFIQKPYTMQVLAARVREALDA
jgi:PAS domain S-box-containing protein